MSAEESFRAGNLDQSFQQLQDQVRNDPSDVKNRIFIFQIMLVQGQWERALNQLNVVCEMDASTLLMAQTYREAIQCEAFRDKVFSGEHSPLIFGKPEQWLALLIEAVKLVANEQYDSAAKLRNEAFELAPVTTGSINGDKFEWIADADTRLGPVLEVILSGRYYWIPFHRIKSIVIEEPEDLRDSVWLPAQFTWANAGQAVGFIPTRYPGSEKADSETIRMAKSTEWQDCGSEIYLGTGQRMLATDNDEHPLMDIREILLDTVDDDPEQNNG